MEAKAAMASAAGVPPSSSSSVVTVIRVVVVVVFVVLEARHIGYPLAAHRHRQYGSLES